MAGRNQHYIPQSFQRGFGAKRKGKPKEIWIYKRGDQPELRRIDKVGSGFDYYSQPSFAQKTLDDKITALESTLANRVAALRALPFGSVVPSTHVIEVIMHLTPRSDYLRSLLNKALDTAVAELNTLAVSPQILIGLLGLSADRPSQRFSAALRRFVERQPYLLAMPFGDLEEEAFKYLKNAFGDVYAGGVEPAMRPAIEQMKVQAGPLSREVHNEELEPLMVMSPEQKKLENWVWSVEPAPHGGAVLPDCIAMTLTADGTWKSFMFGSEPNLIAAAFPLSTFKILVGRPPDCHVPSLDNLNREAAACSSEFFLAHIASDELRSLSELVGSGVDEIMLSAVRTHRARQSTDWDQV